MAVGLKRASPGALLPPLNRALDALERRLVDGSDRPLTHRPIFLIGAPRSGTTLLSQLLIHAYDVGFLANVHDLLHGAPSLVEQIVRVADRKRESDFSSRHGNVPGYWSPSESWDFWFRFFPRKAHYVALKDADPAEMLAMRGVVRRIADGMGRPLLFKNLACSLRLGPLAHYLPEALFIVIRRDLARNAASLLAARKRIRGSYDAWWSTKPRNVEEILALPVHAQVVEQVLQINETINEARRGRENERFFDVTYEDLCSDTSATLDAFDRFLAAHRCSIPRVREIPAAFPLTEKSTLSGDLERALEDYAAGQLSRMS